MRHATLLLTVFMLLIMATACRNGDAQKSGQLPDDALITVDDSTLTRTEVLRHIPEGITPEDSAAMFGNFVRYWTEQMLLADIADENIEERERIDRLTEQYRRSLIIESYRRRLRESQKDNPSDDAMRRYYEQHQKELILQRPVIKGVFIKIPKNARRLSDIRRWMATATPSAIDNLEKYGLDDALKYSIFEDEWTDFQAIATQIPYKFSDSDSFVESTKNFETTYGGITYLLHISSYLSTGENMPYEVAKPERLRVLREQQSADLERRMMIEIYNKALKKGRLKIENKENVKIYLQ